MLCTKADWQLPIQWRWRAHRDSDPKCQAGAKTIRSEKLQNESSPNFSNFCPEFCPEFCSEFSPNFSRSFRASFRGKRRPEKIHQKSPPFFNVKFPGKNEKNIHKIFLESGQSKRPLKIAHQRRVVQHFYFSHRPPLFLGVGRLSGSWRGSVLSQFSVGFRSVFGHFP